MVDKKYEPIFNQKARRKKGVPFVDFSSLAEDLDEYAKFRKRFGELDEFEYLQRINK